MKTLLVISPNNGLAAAVRVVLDSDRYRVIEHDSLRENELRLIGASIDLCVFDADLTTVEPIRNIEDLRKFLPRCPLILYSSDAHWSWEEEAYMLGVNHILSKPVRGRLLNTLVGTSFRRPDPAGGKAVAAASARLGGEAGRGNPAGGRTHARMAAQFLLHPLP